MTDDVRGLLGGYATGNLTSEQRERLLRAALEDPAAFEALADEDALRELLEDAGARARLLEATEHRHFSMGGLFHEWLDRPKAKVLVAAGIVAVAGIAVRTVWERQNEPPRTSPPPIRVESVQRAPVPADPQALLQYVVLRSSGSGEEQPEPVRPDYLFTADDLVGMRIRSNVAGLLQVRDESGRVIHSEVAEAGQVVTVPARTRFGDRDERSFAVSVHPSPDGVVRLRNNSGATQEPTGNGARTASRPGSELLLKITLRRKN